MTIDPKTTEKAQRTRKPTRAWRMIVILALAVLISLFFFVMLFH